jgi:hypothetical protein
VVDQGRQRLARLPAGTCAASVAPTTVTIARGGANNADIVLTWDANLANADHEVWRSSDPYIDPANPGAVTPVIVNDPTYTDSGAAAGSLNRFYVVRGVNACGQASPNSPRTGVFHFAVVSGQ